MIHKTPQEKFNVVKDAYLNDSIPTLWTIYEKTGFIKEPFLIANCIILSLAGYYSGAIETDSREFKKFVNDFFPNNYSGKNLWYALRNYLVHGFTVARPFILSKKHPESHLKTIEHVKSELTGKETNLTILNFEDFYKDLQSATIYYFSKVETDPDLLNKLCKRYDSAPFQIFVHDTEIDPSSLLGQVMIRRNK